MRRTRSAGDGRTVLLSSHILSEVEALCDRVTIIRGGPHGGDRHAGRPAPPDPHLGQRRAGPAADRAGEPARRARPATSRAPGCSCEVDNSRAGRAARRLTAAGVRSLVSQPPTLEELFLRHYDATPRHERRRARPAAAPHGARASAGRYRRAGPAGAAPGPDHAGHLGATRSSAAVASTAYSYHQLYPTAARPRWRTASPAQPALLALSGPVYGDSLGALIVWKVGAVRRGAAPRLMGIFAGDPAHPGRGGGRAAGAGRRHRRSAGTPRWPPRWSSTVGANLVVGAAARGRADRVGLPAAGSLALGVGDRGWPAACSPAWPR